MYHIKFIYKTRRFKVYVTNFKSESGQFQFCFYETSQYSISKRKYK